MNNDRIYYSHDAEMHAMHSRAVLSMAFLTFGLGIGATLAMLFAPTSGKATRHNLAKSVEGGLRTAHETVEPLVKHVDKEFGELKKNVEEHLK